MKPQIVDEMPKGLLGNKTMRGIQYQGEMYILEIDCREMVNTALQKHFQRAESAEKDRDALAARCEKLEDTLRSAVLTIKQWHNMGVKDGSAQDGIRAALALLEPKQEKS